LEDVGEEERFYGEEWEELCGFSILLTGQGELVRKRGFMVGTFE
jgi:hypothetical protein